MATAKPSAFKSAPIVHTPRTELRDAVRQEFKALGATNIIIPATHDECIEQLVLNPESFLVLDWECGSIAINQILSACRGHFHIETRPSFLVVAEVDPHVIATGYEYGVSQIHAGPISRLSIRECLEALINEDDSTKVIKDGMIKVAQYRSHGEWNLATPLLQDMLQQFPDNERITVELAENLIAEERWPEALKILKPLAEKDPAVVRALHLLGRCLMQMGEYDEAIGFLSRAKIINPHNVDRLIDLGQAFIRNDQLVEAMSTFEEVVQIDSSNKQALTGKSQCLLMTGEVNEALGLLKTISGPREMASIFNTAAVLSMRAGYFDKGMNLYRSALAALGRNDKIASRLYFNMGLGFKRQDMLAKAVACFGKSFSLDPSYIKAAKHKEHAEAKLAAGGQAQKVAGDEGFQEEEFSSVGKRPGAAIDLEIFEDIEPEGFDS